MRQQTKPFIVEIKQSRKLKATDPRPSIWGKLDLTSDQHTPAEKEPRDLSAVAGDNDRP
ncbi:hypothetical protein HFO68_30665 [Rhizobium laguerreae]|uniref:hypothetical protein n=1 Tax=Rhizobium TaxID=379 RepID=UPI001952FE48|nr:MULTISPECIES: hypothetical protein [Rhizobium]MBY3074868.1 hypothetical protein [Rhizobium laguerreae]MBY3081795.1 hypothetical protein [Rhizobium laguerreae]MBY3088697.1 hypothetical protein [Rhizobium laguerreae]MBY3108886.1 hypothetical protein [Rhizobium laguerreae]MBY3129658.1 hypothetical protein [Rhizobium laguerreae]